MADFRAARRATERGTIQGAAINYKERRSLWMSMRGTTGLTRNYWIGENDCMDEDSIELLQRTPGYYAWVK